MTSVEPPPPSPSDESGLQPERTGLAWNRTLVVMAVAFGILGVHAYRDGLHVSGAIVSALIAAVIVLLSTPFGRARSERATELMEGSRRLMPPAPLLGLSATTSALALASFVLIIVRG